MDAAATMSPRRAPIALVPGASGVRALVCLYVLGHHVALSLGSSAGALGRVFLQTGGHVVAGFFVLSGFLLSRPFWRAAFRLDAFPDLRAYAARRAARVIPAYYVCLLVTFLLFGEASGSDLLRLGTGLGFVNSLHWRTFFPARVNAPLWTIGVEAWSYLLLPLWGAALLRTRTRGGARLLTLGVLLASLVAQAAIVAATPRLVAPTGPHDDGLFGIAVLWLPNRNPLGLFPHALVGALAGSFAVDRAAAPAPGSARRLNRFDLLAVVSLMALGTDLFLRRVPGPAGAVRDALQVAWSHRHAPFLDGRWPGYPAFTALLLLGLARSGVAGRLFDVAPFRVTARMSYGIYLWQLPILHGLHRLLDGSGALASSAGAVVYALVGVALCYAAGYASARLLDAPSIAWSRRYAARRSLARDGGGLREGAADPG